MDKEKKIRAVVSGECWITEEEQKMILAYRETDASTKRAVKRILDSEEDNT